MSWPGCTIAPSRRTRSTNTRSGAKPASTSRTVRPASALPATRKARRSHSANAGTVSDLPRRRHRRLEGGGLRAQVHAHQLRRERREEEHDEARAHQVTDGVRDGNVVQQHGLLRLGDGQPADRVARRADDRGLGEGAGQQAGCGADVVAHHPGRRDRGDQAGHAQHDRQRRLRQRLPAEPAEELRADLVAGREQEQVEEHQLDDRRDRDADLTDQHAREQRADDVAELEAADADPTDDEPDRQRQEDGQLGVVPQGREEDIHPCAPGLACVSPYVTASPGRTTACRSAGTRAG